MHNKNDGGEYERVDSRIPLETGENDLGWVFVLYTVSDVAYRVISVYEPWRGLRDLNGFIPDAA